MRRGQRWILALGIGLLAGSATGQTTLNRQPLWLAGAGDCNHAVFNNGGQPCGNSSPTGTNDSEYVAYFGGLVFQPRISGLPSYFTAAGNMIVQGNVGIIAATSGDSLTVSGGGVQWSGAVDYANTLGAASSASGGWARLGTLTLPQQGYNAQLRLYGGNGYNAVQGQNGYTSLFIRTSNAGSVDGNGFCATAFAEQYGLNTGFVGQIKLVGNLPGCNATSYTIFINTGAYVGNGFYSVETSGGSWAPNISGSGADPGPSSSSILAVPYFNEIAGTLYAASGKVGIGTTTPGATLDVNGNIRLSGSGASIMFQDGTTQATAFTGVTCGGDYAESVDVSGDKARYEPGDVLVIGADSASDVAKSAEPYSTLVAGIYSTRPGVVGRRQLTDAKTSTTEIPMAMVGIVPTKVSAENGPIHRGDLLVSSSTVGHAMRGTDPGRMLGAVVGKALGNLESGTGVIEVLVTLQ